MADPREGRFYHLMHTALERALPALLHKALSGGRRILVVSPEAARLAALDQILWTWRDDSFLPHGLAGEPHAQHQPILLSPVADPVNQATMVVGLDQAALDPAQFALTCLMFDGRDEAAVADARGRWRAWKAAGVTLSYWQQQEDGGWQQRAG